MVIYLLDYIIAISYNYDFLKYDVSELFFLELLYLDRASSHIYLGILGTYLDPFN